jgi:hypothetical protein
LLVGSGFRVQGSGFRGQGAGSRGQVLPTGSKGQVRSGRI